MILDQHFMTSNRIINDIVSFADLKPSDTVLEIGSGTGNLTEELRKKCKVITIEIDRKFKSDIKGNALKIRFPEFTKIVSNLPYSICEPLLWKLLRCNFDLAVLTVPKSFYRKLVSGTKIGLICKDCFDVEFKIDIPREAFKPVPKTNSCIIALKPKQGKLKELFVQYDKKVHNALLKFFTDKGMTKNEAREKILKIDLSEKILNEKISHLSFENLCNIIKKLVKKLN